MAKMMAATLGEAVAILMQSKTHRQKSLAEIEARLVPAVLSGQIMLAEAQSKTSGQTAPVALLTWASVSDEIDARVSASPSEPMRLVPADWKSGPNLWIVEAVGPPRVVQALLMRLRQANGAQAVLKARARRPDGTVDVIRLTGPADEERLSGLA